MPGPKRGDLPYIASRRALYHTAHTHIGSSVRFTRSLTALIALAGCHGHDASKTAAAVPSTAVTDSAVASRDADLRCKDTIPSHPDPGKLIREYLRRDAGGEFLNSNKFWLSATECAAGGSDFAQVITSYTIDSLGIRSDTARFAVQYRFLGDLLQGPAGFAPKVRTEADTFVVIRRSYGWRIVGQHEMPILLRNAAQRYWPLSRADLARLDSAARSAPD